MDKFKLQKKVISKTKNAFTSVQQEMAIMKKLDHPHIVKLYEIIDDPKEKKLYLITEFVKKGNLEKKVK
jgi:calcium/calmodulin-dependent protein kinase kinase 2